MKRPLALAAGLAAVLLVAGCAGGGTPAPTGGTAAPAEGAYDPDATFTWVYSTPAGSLDPTKIKNGPESGFLYPIYDTLTFEAADLTLHPMLAESWELSEDGKDLTLTLIDGWTYHDGTPFDAESVKANLERNGAEGSFSRRALAPLTGVDVLDDRTLVLHTATAASPLIGIIAGPAGMMMSPAAFDKAGEDTAPTGGSGQYRVTSFDPNAQITYEAVDDYWDADLRRPATIVTLIAGDDNARLNLVLSGDGDATYLGAAVMAPAEQAASGGDFVIFGTPGVETWQLNLNTSIPPLDDVRVRQAIAAAIDRQGLSEISNGLCSPEVQLFPSTYWAGDPDITADQYPRDTELASELLADAGYPDGFSIDMDILARDTRQQSWGEIIQQNLADVGIKVNLLPKDPAVKVEDFQVAKTSAISLGGQKANPDPSITVSDYLLADGTLNPGGLANDEIAELAQQALLGDQEARGAVYHEIMALSVENASPIVFCNNSAPFISNLETHDLPTFASGIRKLRGVWMSAE
ncbi:MAG: hypothetical protein J7480_05070 [Microbacteriaceae bacterium]|nr:hypothetical protein [Microbacteriaceae bacterium]